MQMTLEANYAVRIVELLATHREKLDAKTIAERSEVPVRFALKILRKLVEDEIVRSYKGSKGGYQLNREPKDITFKDVIESVEGEFMLSRCLDKDYCNRTTHCHLHCIYAEITNDFRSKLDDYNFGNVYTPKEVSDKKDSK